MIDSLKEYFLKSLQFNTVYRFLKGTFLAAYILFLFFYDISWMNAYFPSIITEILVLVNL